MDQLSKTTKVSGEANVLKTQGALDPTKPYTELHLADGEVLRFDTRHLARVEAGSEINGIKRELEADRLVIPLIDEQLTIERRVVPTGKVTLQKIVQEYEHRLDETLALRTYDIERKILNQPIDEIAVVRQEGETTVYPVIEEQLILTKQLILKEEIHVKRRDGVKQDNQVVVLKREHLIVQREEVPSGQQL